MTSSVSGSVGTATESNHCSANGFLDAFARYRQSLGKLVSSIGFGMISEVHENSEIEALLLRKGIQPLNEEEFLQIFNLSLSGTPSAGGMKYDKLAKSHILTGLKSHDIRKMMEKGFNVNNGIMQDPRTVLLFASLDASSEDDGAALTSIDASWSKGLPAAVIKALTTEAAGATSLNEAVLALVSRRFSNLPLMSPNKVNTNKALAVVRNGQHDCGRVPIVVLECVQGRCFHYWIFLSSRNHLQKFGRHGGDGDFRKIAVDEKKRCGRCCGRENSGMDMHFYR
jgi:hypothetical protein